MIGDEIVAGLCGILLVLLSFVKGYIWYKWYKTILKDRLQEQMLNEDDANYEDGKVEVLNLTTFPNKDDKITDVTIELDPRNESDMEIKGNQENEIIDNDKQTWKKITTKHNGEEIVCLETAL